MVERSSRTPLPPLEPERFYPRAEELMAQAALEAERAKTTMTLAGQVSPQLLQSLLVGVWLAGYHAAMLRINASE
jgi:hypothetical protein